MENFDAGVIRCKNCRNYRSLYYFDDECWRKTNQFTCKRLCNIKEMDNAGCFKFASKDENYEFLENNQINIMNIILVMKKELDNMKEVIKIFEKAFYGEKKE